MTVRDGTDGGHPVVVRVEPHQWALLRAVRLEALRQAPDAFGATYADESIEPLSFWTYRTLKSQWMVALDGIRPIGVVAMVEPANDRAGEQQLDAMWVSPSRRGSPGDSGCQRTLFHAHLPGSALSARGLGPCSR